MPTRAPDIITRYLHAADTRDSQACASCFTENGTVLDEGTTYTGRAAILAWRDDLLGRFTYTTTVTASEPVSDREYRVAVRVDGDFPGGTAQLSYDFVIEGELIAALKIVG